MRVTVQKTPFPFISPSLLSSGLHTALPSKLEDRGPNQDISCVTSPWNKPLLTFLWGLSLHRAQDPNVLARRVLGYLVPSTHPLYRPVV